jgi:hypothetical protein
MSTKEVAGVNQEEAPPRWKPILWSAIKLNVAISGFLVIQWLLFRVNTSAIVLPEVAALSFLISWRFEMREAPSRSLWHGAMLGVIASVLRTGFILLFMPGGIVLFATLSVILPITLIFLGCVAGGFLASRR